MKKRSKILIGLMSLSLLGGVGSVLALTRNSSTASSTSPAFDKAIYLYWDSEVQSSAHLGDIDHAEINTPVYRYLTVSPKSSKSVAGTVTVTFTLAAQSTTVVTGLSVTVYETASLANDDTVASLIGADEHPVVISSATSLTGSKTFNVTTSSSAHETQKFYAIKVLYDGTAPAGSTLGGLVTITQSFAE